MWKRNTICEKVCKRDCQNRFTLPSIKLCNKKWSIHYNWALLATHQTPQAKNIPYQPLLIKPVFTAYSPTQKETSCFFQS